MSVVDEVLAERARQIAKGYTAEHDDVHTVSDFGNFIGVRRSRLFGDAVLRGEHRQALVEIAALAVAAVESDDRKRGHR